MANAQKFFELSEKGREALLAVMKEQMAAGAGGKVLVLAAFLDAKLLELTVMNMPGIDKDIRRDLLSGTGGLATFSSRINLAKAFGWIDAHTARELHKMRKVRNHFAHSSKVVSFDDKELLALVDKFDRTKISANAKSIGVISRVGKLLAEATEVAILECQKRIEGSKVAGTKVSENERGHRRRR